MSDQTQTRSVPAPAPVTVGRVLRLRRLFADLGVMETIRQAEETQPEPEATPTTFADALKSQQPVPDEQVFVRIDLGALDRALWEDGRVLDLVQILFECADEDEAGEVEPEAIEAALIPFVGAWSSVSATVAGCGTSWG